MIKLSLLFFVYVAVIGAFKTSDMTENEKQKSPPQLSIRKDLKILR